jgi:hypothetical protein
MRLEAHVYQEDQIVEQLRVAGGRIEITIFDISWDLVLKEFKLFYYFRVRVVGLLNADVKEQKFVPRCMKEFIQEYVLLRIAP